MAISLIESWHETAAGKIEFPEGKSRFFHPATIIKLYLSIDSRWGHELADVQWLEGSHKGQVTGQVTGGHYTIPIKKLS